MRFGVKWRRTIPNLPLLRKPVQPPEDSFPVASKAHRHILCAPRSPSLGCKAIQNLLEYAIFLKYKEVHHQEKLIYFKYPSAEGTWSLEDILTYLLNKWAGSVFADLDPRLHCATKEKEEPTKHRHHLTALLERLTSTGEMAQRTQPPSAEPMTWAQFSGPTRLKKRTTDSHEMSSGFHVYVSTHTTHK